MKLPSSSQNGPHRQSNPLVIAQTRVVIYVTEPRAGEINAFCVASWLNEIGECICKFMLKERKDTYEIMWLELFKTFLEVIVVR